MSMTKTELMSEAVKVLDSMTPETLRETRQSIIDGGFNPTLTGAAIAYIDSLLMER